MSRHPSRTSPGSRGGDVTAEAAWQRRRSGLRRVGALGVAIVVVTSLLLALLWSSFQRYDDVATRTVAASRAADQMLTAMLDQETGVRGYLNTADERLLAPYRAGQEAFARAVRDLQQAAAPGTLAGDLLEEQLNAGGRWGARAERVVAQARLEGRRPAQQLSAALRRKRAMDRFRRANSRFQLVIERHGSDLRADSRSREITTLALIALLLLTAAALALHALGRRERRNDMRTANVLREQAFTDRLTGLANRAMLEDALGRLLSRPARAGCHEWIVLLDLDDFKLVNDSLGHHAGDRLLQIVGERLTATVRPGDIVARVGGDEFAVLIETANPQGGMLLAKRLLEALASRAVIDDRMLAITPSIGVAPLHAGQSVEQVLRSADLALYKAKRDGKRQVAAYEDDLHTRAMERLELDGELRHAVERDELVLHFQPVFATQTSRLIGFEALVRWQHPRHGLIAPGAFIEMAEENGAITTIGRWVLGEACRQASVWQRDYGRTLTMAINLSSVQLDDPALIDDVAGALRDHSLDPATIVLEITETALMDDVDATHRVLVQLKALGVKLALDDFGTGYSSLGRLKGLPLDELKMPKAFVDGIAHHKGDLAVARGIVDLAHGMRLGVVAEGIEHADQLDCLGEIGCDLAQGFHMARPAPAADIEQQHLLTTTVPPLLAG